MSKLSKEYSGAGSALIMALRREGGTIGAALLGTMLNAAYRGGLNTAGLSFATASTVRDSASGGVVVAHGLGSSSLLHAVCMAFVQAMDQMLMLCAGIALAGVALALVFLSRRRVAPADAQMKHVELEHEVVA
jgi:hypothetical protein